MWLEYKAREKETKQEIVSRKQKYIDKIIQFLHLIFDNIILQELKTGEFQKKVLFVTSEYNLFHVNVTRYKMSRKPTMKINLIPTPLLEPQN